MTMSQWDYADRRASPRAHLQLRLAVVYPQQEGRPYRPVYHGTCHDVGMSGLSMVADENAFHEGEVTVILALPPVHSWAAQKVVTVSAKMTYAIHSSKLNAYKIGMKFLEFRADGRELLQAALQQQLQAAGDAAALAPDSCAAVNDAGDSRPLDWW